MAAARIDAGESGIGDGEIRRNVAADCSADVACHDGVEQEQDAAIVVGPNASPRLAFVVIGSVVVGAIECDRAVDDDQLILVVDRTADGVGSVSGEGAVGDRDDRAARRRASTV